MTKRKKSTRPARADAPTIPADSPLIALKLKLPCRYTLLGYYTSAGAASIVLVQLHEQGNPTHFATYQVVDVEGTCILARNFGELDETPAREDFWRRTSAYALLSGKKPPKATARQAWEDGIARRAAEQQRARTSK